MDRLKELGFSLIELMIVVAIIGIIASIAVPAYQQYAYESKRSDAYAALTSAAAEQEKFYTYDNRYSMDISELGGSLSPGGHYALSVIATDTTYSLTATAVSTSSQIRDVDCRTLTLNHLGVRGSTNASGNPSSGCW